MGGLPAWWVWRPPWALSAAVAVSLYCVVYCAAMPLYTQAPLVCATLRCSSVLLYRLCVLGCCVALCFFGVCCVALTQQVQGQTLAQVITEDGWAEAQEEGHKQGTEQTQ